MNAPVLFLEVLFTPFDVTTTSAGLFAAAGRLPWWEIVTGILTVPAGVAGLIYTLVQIHKAWIEMEVQKEKIKNRVHKREVEPEGEGSVDNGMIGKPGSPPPKLALPVGKMDIAKYRHFHEELVRLATDALCLRGQEGTVLEKLTSLADTIRRNRFKIVLVSPFQGGKSTIFNTACGGRELSPVGFGLKTAPPLRRHMLLTLLKRMRRGRMAHGCRDAPRLPGAIASVLARTPGRRCATADSGRVGGAISARQSGRPSAAAGRR